MRTKIFIGYSHQDDLYRKELETHLSLLKRNRQIETWSDRKISPGQEWQGKIDTNLCQANVIIFLISSDFIASDYCYDIETRKALGMHELGTAIVIPIIVRPCDWNGSPFSKLEALPTKAKPVSTWQNKDEAWLDIVTGIKKNIESIQKKSLPPPQQDTIWSNSLTAEFFRWLNDTEVELSHRCASKVLLDDIFVTPDLRCLDNDIDKIAVTVDAVKAISNPGFKLIFGDEQSGKTSLGKRLFIQYLQSDQIPIFLKGEDIKTSDIENVASKAYQKQYSNSSLEDYKKKENKVIIIDDYTSIKLNRKFQNIFIENIKKQFKSGVFLSIDSFQYVVSEISAFDGFSHFEILSFGNEKRAALIEKWLEIGVKEEIDECDLYSNLDEIKLHIDSFVKNNIVPSKPIYLLAMLQTFESVSPQRIELTSYGHCYQYLIYCALEKVKIKQTELDSYINFLTELAREVFDNHGLSLTEKQVDNLFECYQNKYLKINRSKMLNDLLRSSILVMTNDRLSFKYRYIYYFYAAKYLAENLTENESNKEKIRNLISLLHKEDCANIIIFITHHTKTSWILDELQSCMMELFDDHEEAKLEKNDLKFMKQFLDDIPRLVLEQKEIKDERKLQNRRKDEAEINECEVRNQSENLEPTDLLAKINRVFKGIELIGQIVRNRHGSLEKSTLISLVEQAYSVGLRFLQYFLVISDSSKDEIIKHIEHMLLENPSVDNRKLEKKAKNVFLLMTYGVIYGVLRKIAFSVGSKEAEEIYKEMETKNNTPAVKLINQAIELQFLKKINAKGIKQLAEELKGNVVCDRILKEIVIQHIYMHHTGYKDKQKLSEILKLPVPNQRALELQKKLEL